MIYHKLCLSFVLLMYLTAPAFALPQITWNTTSHEYSILDKTGTNTNIVASFKLVENTYECLSNCEAKIYVNVTNQILFNQYLTSYLSVNKNSTIFKNIEIKYSAPYLYITGTKNIKPNILSKNGIEEKINLNSNYDWILDIGGNKLSNWAWWNSSWNYRACFNITNINDTKTNYPLKIFLNNSWGLAHFNFSNVTDLRFTDNSTNPLIFWHERNDSILNNSYEYVALNLSSGVNQTICMYYNNPTAASLSNFNSTFPNGNSITTFFDFSNDLINYGYSQLNGTAYNGATPYLNKQNWINNSYYFNGIYQSINSSDSVLYDTQTFSISFMYNSTTLARQASVSKFWDDASRQWYIGMNDDTSGANKANQITFLVGYSGSSKYVNCTTPTGVQTDGTFHYYTTTYDGATGSIYLDGDLLCSKNIGYTMLYNTAGFIIGQNAYGSGKDMPSTAVIYNVKFYNKTLSLAEINQSYITVYPSIEYGQEVQYEIPATFTIISTSPINNTVYNQSTITFDFNVSGSNTTYNCSSYLNNSIIYQNSSVINASLISFNVNLNDTYNYSYYTNCSTSGVTNSSPVSYFNISLPHYFSVTSLNPSNNSTNYGSETFTYIINGTENLYNCSLYINNTLNQTNISISNATASSFYLTGLSIGAYSWYVNCTSHGLTNSSESRVFNVITTPIVSHSKREIVYCIKEIVRI